MRVSKTARHVLRHPVAFAWLTLTAFSRNQGLLLAGAVAYYTLLSAVPLLILSVIVLSHFVSQQELLGALGEYLDWLVPSQSSAVLSDVAGFLRHRLANSAILVSVMVFFSSLAFAVTEKAMAIIFPSRGRVKKRHVLVSAVLPYFFAFVLGAALMGVTVASVVLQELGEESVHFLGHTFALRGIAGLLLYLVGVAAETVILTTVYLVLPVGAVRANHAFFGGLVASILWEAVRHVLLWYFSTVSMASVVYGSLTTAVIALLSLEIAATLFLFGAQVISEYERLEERYEYM